MRAVLALLIMLAGSLVFLLLWLWPRTPFLEAVSPAFSLERFDGNPVVHAGLHPLLDAGASEGGYVNINGPSFATTSCSPGAQR